MAVMQWPSPFKSHMQMRISMSTGRQQTSHFIPAAGSATNAGQSSLTIRRSSICNQDYLFNDRHLVDSQIILARTNLATDQGEGLEEEVRAVMERLERVAEKMKCRVRGGNARISDEDGLLLEKMSEEIVSSFLEKPIRFLKSNEGKLVDRLKDLNFLADILEQPCQRED